MIQFKDISIPKPCSVHYDELPGGEAKRFCGSCEKQVYDFRGKDEIYFNSVINTHGKVCGIFYEDEINTRTAFSTTINRKSFLVRLLSILFFIKTSLTIQDSKASQPISHQTVQFSKDVDTDSTKIKTKVKGKLTRGRVDIDIYINNVLYKKTSYLQRKYIYLPDTIKPNDKIKIKVNDTAYRSKTYKFKYTHSENITIKIIGRDPIHIFKRRTSVGVPGDFW